MERAWQSIKILMGIGVLVLIGFLCLATQRLSKAGVTWLQTTSASISSVSQSVNQAANTIQTQVPVTASTINKAVIGISANVSSAENDIHQTSTTLNSAVNETSAELNRPCRGPSGPDACGLIAQTKKTIIQAGDATVTAQTQIVTAQKSATQSMVALTDFLNSPDLIGTVKNLNTTTKNLSASTTDFQNKFHDFLYPPPCKTKWCKIKKIYPYVKGASEMAEPSYWAYQLYKGTTP